MSQKEDKPKDDKKKDKKQKEEDLTEEDRELKDKLDLFVERLQDQDTGLSKTALKNLVEEVRSATTSITSVPKSLKFLKPHYPVIRDHYDNIKDTSFKKQYADFLSVLSMTMGVAGQQQSLKYLMEGTLTDYLNWGQEYLLHLSGDIAQEYNRRLEAQEQSDDLFEIVKKIVPQLMSNHAESYAIDLLLEVDALESVEQFVNEHNYSRVTMYLLSSSQYSADQDELVKTIVTCYNIAMNLKQYSDALRFALKLDDIEKMQNAFNKCQDIVIKKQMALELARRRVQIDLDEDLSNIASNSLLSEFFVKLAKDLDVLEPKDPESIYKSHLEEKKVNAQIDSAKENLAATIVNAFVNAGCGKDSLMLNNDPKADPWIHKVKADGAISATASLGLTFLWDTDGGAKEIVDYLDLKDGYARMGACIAVGLYNSGVSSDVDPAKALLEDQMDQKSDHAKLGAVIGMGLAYAGTGREDFLEILTPIVAEVNQSVELSAFAALSLGLIFVGTKNDDIATVILETLGERPENQLNMTMARFFGVGLALLFLGKQEACEPTIDLLSALVTHPIKQYVETLIEACAYVGSGNVLKVQKMLHVCLEHLEEKDAAHQAVAVLGIGLIAASEDIGNEMAIRSMNNLLQYGDITVKRAVPLALALLHVSNPKIPIQDLMSKLAYDNDEEMSHRAIIGLGIIGAGTNNSRLAGILRSLASYYAKDSSSLFLVRIAQGMIHMGKGLLTLQPYYSDKFLFSPISMCGLITFMNACLDTKYILCDKYHYMFYYLALAMYPRMMFTVDENLQHMPIQVRVGQAVDTVGQAGQPKRITGFQTHTSPVILAYGERAELATEEYIPVSNSILENIIIVKKNPDYKEDEKPRKKTSL